TKAKRRVTLSICGLGLLDETEVENVTVHEKQTPRPAIQTAEHIPNAPKIAAPKAVIETETKVVEERLEMPEMPTTAATATEESTPSYFKVTEKQAYLVKKLLKQTNLPQDLAEEWLNQHFGVTKVEDLSRYKASDAINLLKGMTATEKTAPTPLVFVFHGQSHSPPRSRPTNPNRKLIKSHVALLWSQPS
ncbi:hypothetical protein EBZ39_17235, partial [bacterium]|nr:hypothetical protein [bacterium]